MVSCQGRRMFQNYYRKSVTSEFNHKIDTAWIMAMLVIPKWSWCRSKAHTHGFRSPPESFFHDVYRPRSKCFHFCVLGKTLCKCDSHSNSIFRYSAALCHAGLENISESLVTLLIEGHNASITRDMFHETMMLNCHIRYGNHQLPYHQLTMIPLIRQLSVGNSYSRYCWGPLHS